MKKLHFKILFGIHKFFQFAGFKKKDNCIIKIWWDEKTQDTLLYANTRSGLWRMPVGRYCKDGNERYSHWLASLTKMEEYGLSDGKKNKTIYTLVDVKITQLES